MAISKKTTKKSSSTSLSAHPPYLQMINEAIASLKDQKGSTQPAIAKFISEKYNPILPPNFTKLLSAQLTKLAKSEKIVKTKNTYKMSTKQDKKAGPVSSKTKESKKNKKTEVKKAKFVVGVESNEKGKRPKMKRLSQVKTPEAMKKRGNLKRMCQVKTPEAVKKNEIKKAKMKRLSQVKTPEAMKKAVYKSTPAPNKVGTKK